MGDLDYDPLDYDLEELFRDNSELLAILNDIENKQPDQEDSADAQQPSDQKVELSGQTEQAKVVFDKNNDVNIDSPSVVEKDEKQISTSRTPFQKVMSLVFNIVFYLLIFAIVGGSTMFAFSNNTEKSIFGYRFYNVLTISMIPTFDAGDMIFIKLCNVDDIKEGDIVTFVPSRKSTAYLTHRVVEVHRGEDGTVPSLVTKGDYNNVNDPPISAGAVVGVYQFHIPKAGAVIQFIRNNFLAMVITIGAGFALIVLLKSYFAAKKED